MVSRVSFGNFALQGILTLLLNVEIDSERNKYLVLNLGSLDFSWPT